MAYIYHTTNNTFIINIIIIISFKFPNTEISTTHVVFILQMRN